MNLKSLIPFGDGGTRAAPPANLFGTLHREIDRLFDDLTRGGLPAFGQSQLNLMPAIDVTETGNEIQITAELPGLEHALRITISSAQDRAAKTFGRAITPVRTGLVIVVPACG